MKKKIITREYCHTLNVYEETSGVCCVTLDMLIAARGIAPEIFREEVCVGNGCGTWSWEKKWKVWKAHWWIDNRCRTGIIVELYSPLVSRHYDEINGGYASPLFADHCYINLMTNEVKFQLSPEDWGAAEMPRSFLVRLNVQNKRKGLEEYVD